MKYIERYGRQIEIGLENANPQNGKLRVKMAENVSSLYALINSSTNKQFNNNPCRVGQPAASACVV